MYYYSNWTYLLCKLFFPFIFDSRFRPISVYVSLSPIYKAAIGKVESDKGIALRFPRFIRHRDDKTVDQATNSE